MPIYEYRCGGCGRELDIFCPLEERNEQICPFCGTALIRAFRTAPATACHGCPSYEFRRKESEQAVRVATDRKFAERNHDEIAHAAKHSWHPVPESQLQREAEALAAKAETRSIATTPSQYAGMV